MKLSITQKTLAILSTSLLWNNEVNAFAPISSRAASTFVSTSTTTRVAQSTLTANGDTAVESASVSASLSSSSAAASTTASVPKAWDCDEEANCVSIDACDEEKCRTTLDVRIHGEWYDMSG